MINLINVTKFYGKDKVLDTINLNIKEGEFCFLVGNSGVGKSSLLKIILKEEQPTSGKIIIDEQDVTSVKDKKLQLVRQKVGFVFQDYKLLEYKTSFENVSMALEICGLSEEKIKLRVPKLLNLVGIKDKIHKYPWQLSGGEKQRLAIARALAHRPKIIIADEPTGNLDPDTGWEILKLLDQVNSFGITVLISTHDISIAEGLNKKIYKLENCKII